MVSRGEKKKRKEKKGTSCKKEKMEK